MINTQLSLLLGKSLADLRPLEPGQPGARLDAHNTSSPGLADLVVLVVEVGTDGGDDLRELLLVLRANVGHNKGGSVLLVHKCAEAGLALDNAVRHVHLAAEGGKPEDELQGVDVVGDDDQLGLLVLDQGCDVVQAVLDRKGLLGAVNLLLGLLVLLLVLLLGLGGTLNLLGGSGLQALLLLDLGLRAVLAEDLEELEGYCDKLK